MFHVCDYALSATRVGHHPFGWRLYVVLAVGTQADEFGARQRAFADFLLPVS
jgi:hypothetical protein